jgi:hypothetical protein
MDQDIPIEVSVPEIAQESEDAQKKLNSIDITENFQKDVQSKGSIINTLSKFLCVSSCCGQNSNINVTVPKTK